MKSLNQVFKDLGFGEDFAEGKPRYFAIQDLQFPFEEEGIIELPNEEEMMEVPDDTALLIEVTKDRLGGFKLEAILWYESDGVYKLTINCVTLGEALAIFAAGARIAANEG